MSRMKTNPMQANFFTRGSKNGEAGQYREPIVKHPRLLPLQAACPYQKIRSYNLTGSINHITIHGLHQSNSKTGYNPTTSISIAVAMALGPILTVRTEGISRQVTEVASSTADNERFNKLQQELAVIKEQLASLVSARQEDIQRARSDVLLPGTPPPPPPPPPPPTSSSSSTSTSVPGLILAKKWSIPQSEAALSMQSVLNELSSSTRRLRQTDSPFLKEAKAKAPLDSTDSIISQLVDDGSAQDSSSYPTTPTPIRRSGVSRTNPTTPTPIRRSGVSSAIPTFETLGSTTLLSRTASTPSTEKKQAIMTDAEMELRWPSPGTIHRADARLDSVAAKLKHPFNIQKRSASTMETKTMTRPDEPPPPARSLSVGMNGGGRNSAGATVPKTSMHVRSGPMMDNSQTKQRPVPQRSSNQLHRSQTDPTRQTFDARKDHRQLQAAKDKQQQEQQQASLIDPSLTIESTSVNSDIRAAKVAAEQDHERKWYLESDMDSWRVST
ncbi:hypothetical protein BG004_004113 [Podila humilis]|nr:hypothetical protein BG004_004113 [Podila humilis]